LGIKNILDDIDPRASFGLNCGFFSTRWIQNVLQILLERLASSTFILKTANATTMKTIEVLLEQRVIIRAIQNQIVLVISPVVQIHIW
jgi:hypothetical protein